MRLCKCGHIESGHIVVRPHTDPPTNYRGFCVIQAKCECNLFVPSGEMADQTMRRTSGVSRVPAAARKDSIAEMLAAAALAVAPRLQPEKSAREILTEAAPDE